nr:MAG TPA: hypothetical protein [Caudoviricetes sp.]
MTWGEIKLAALQTMFSNEGVALTVDDTNRDYINAMPAKANEAMHQIALVGRPILKSWQITVSAAAEEEAADEKGLLLPAKKGTYKVCLADYLPRFRCIDDVKLDDGRTYGAAQDTGREGDSTLLLPGEKEGTYTLWYRAYPQKITAGTPDDLEVDMAPEAAALIPLYIAAELYKEDDAQIATILRNEYEDGLVKVQTAFASSGAGFRAAAVRNTTGWW